MFARPIGIYVFLSWLLIVAFVSCAGRSTAPQPGALKSDQKTSTKLINVVFNFSNPPGSILPHVVSYRHKKRLVTRILRVRANTGTVGDLAALIGTPYGPQGWSYSGMDPSCGSLTWTYVTTIPNSVVTWDPDPPNTPLDGSENVTVSIPATTPVGQYTQTIAGHCTNPNHTGVGPGAKNFVIGAVVLDIVDIPQNQSVGSIVTNATTNKIVGSFVDLLASPQPAATFDHVSWSVAGDKIAGYTQTVAGAVLTHLTSLASPEVTFYWQTGGDPNPQAVNLSAGFPTNWGDPWGDVYTQANFLILSPTAVGANGTAGEVLVNPLISFDCQTAIEAGSTTILPPYPPPCPVPTGTSVPFTEPPGMRFAFTAKAPVGGAGSLSATQLIDSTGSITVMPGNTPAPFQGTDGQELDTCVHYPMTSGTFQAIGGNSEATWTSSDSPGTTLLNWISFTRMDTFQTYFVYRKSDMNGALSGRKNIWVAIGRLNWHWNGTADLKTPSPTATPPTPAPYWKKSSGLIKASLVNLPFPEPLWGGGYVPDPTVSCPAEITP